MSGEDLETNWREILFPRNIGQTEARKLCNYLVTSLDGPCYVSLDTDKHETFGERFATVRPSSLDEVPLIPGGLKLRGTINRTPTLTCAEFSFLRGHDKKMDRTTYRGLQLSLGAYDWDEISEPNRNLVTDIRAVVRGYFEGPA